MRKNELYKKYKSKFIFLTLMIIIFIGLNCKDKLVNSTPVGAYYPIDVGNEWYYNYSYYDSLGNILDSSIIKETFVGTRIKSNSPVYLFDSPLNPKSPACCNYVFYYQNKPGGVYEYIASDTMGYWVDEIQLYKYPCSENDLFTNGINDFDTTFVVSLDDTVICEAGTFSCIVYKKLTRIFSNTSSTVTGYLNTYVAYGVGKVRLERFSSDSSHRFYKDMEYSLKSYYLNQ